MRSATLRLTALAGLALSAPVGLSAQGVGVSGSVGHRGLPLSRAAVYMEPVGDKAVADPRTAEIDQVHLRFVPDVVVVSPGSEVRFLNSDPLMHNVFGPGIRDGAVFDLGTYPQGLYGSWTFQREGLHYVLCHIHPEMVAYVVVTESPFHAVTNGDGTFSIDEVPPGLYDVTLWHPRRSRETTTVRLNVPEGGIGDVRLTLGDTVARLGGDP